MDQLSIARRAIDEEVAALSAEITRLQSVLAILDRTTGPVTKTPAAKTPAATPATIAPAKRGRPGGQKKAAAADSSIVAALKLIQGAGKGGIKALSLASLLKKSKVVRPSKVELLESGNVKATGIGGGTTYTYVG